MPSLDNLLSAAVHAAALPIVLVLGLRLRVQAGALGTGRAVVLAFVAAWIMLFLASVVFHLSAGTALGRLTVEADQAAIFVLIAAAWAPIAPFKLDPPDDRAMLRLVIGSAAAGLGLEVALVAMGRQGLFNAMAPWLFLAQAVAPLLARGRHFLPRLSAVSLGWLFGSSAVYLIGLGFYLRRDMPFGHVAWHVAIVIGCLMNFRGVSRLITERAGGR